MKVCLLLLVCAAGCDSGTMMPGADQPPVFVQPTPSDAMGPASLGCVGGHADGAAPTTATAVDLTVKDFEKSTPVAGATVEVYTSLAHVNAMAPDATSAPSDADGKTSIMVPPGSYRVIFRTVGAPNTIETIEFNRAYNDGARVSVSQATKSEIPALLNIAPDDTKGVVAGSQRDCVEAELGGITVRCRPTAAPTTAATNIFYFQDFGDLARAGAGAEVDLGRRRLRRPQRAAGQRDRHRVRARRRDGAHLQARHGRGAGARQLHHHRAARAARALS